jgi:hypothetical protein
MRKLFAVAAVAIALLSGGWSTTHVIRDRPGGNIVDHIAEFQGWHGDPVIIDGECDSACTMVIGFTNKICATPRGVLGFHSASDDRGYSLEGTRMMWFFYSDNVRKVLARHGWSKPSKHPDIIPIKATEILPACGVR